MDYFRYARFAPLGLFTAGALLLPACSHAPNGRTAGAPELSPRAQVSAAVPARDATLIRQAGFEFDAPPLPTPKPAHSLTHPVELQPSAQPNLVRLPEIDGHEANDLSNTSSSRSAGPTEPESTPPLELNGPHEMNDPGASDEAPPSPIAERLPPVEVEAEHLPTRLPAVDIEGPAELPLVPPVAAAPSAPAPAPAAKLSAPALLEAPKSEVKPEAPATPAVVAPPAKVAPPAAAAEASAPAAAEKPKSEIASLPAVETIATLPQPAPEATAQSQAGGDSRSSLAAINQQAETYVRQGISLAERGALFSARAQFIQALKLLAQSHDLAENNTTHSQALAAGLRALKEVDDFVPSGSRLDADLNVPALVTAHRTPVLKDASAGVSPVIAAQKYYTFAQEQLAVAAGGEPVGSWALYALGRMHGLREATSALGPGGRSKAIVMLQAALMVDSRNHMAANELGVLLARSGQWEEARRALEHSVAQSRRAETLQNLATVYTQLGQGDLAARSRQEADLLAGQSAGRAAVAASDTANVRWLDAKQFAQTAPASDLMLPNQAPARTPAAAAPATRGGEGTASLENRATKSR